jgi:hypothetical protein
VQFNGIPNRQMKALQEDVIDEEGGDEHETGDSLHARLGVYWDIRAKYRTWKRLGGGTESGAAHWYDARALAVMASQKEEFTAELQKLNAARQEASSRSSLALALAISGCIRELKRDVAKVQNIIAERELELERANVSSTRAELISEVIYIRYSLDMHSNVSNNPNIVQNYR